MYRDAAVKEELRKRAPNLRADIDSMAFHAFSGSIENNVKKSMTFLKESPLVRESLKPSIRGFVFDLHSGELKEVKL
ncbi:carbonate dehydratase [Cladophialophora psammophila CBS 110553]|uniref:Carbonate dehydratase n=1 Tax=Cladophialophora psammophila CBS 110553 TaxID=1182543 RepID=W9WNN0_9EURO|nr:carbonate dehydratase [Cladophialophora psammophila CBS 110553]EXJ66610.1 carbonate dehydratase [Cladophialophora psammophila CBS 110553]